MLFASEFRQHKQIKFIQILLISTEKERKQLCGNQLRISINNYFTIKINKFL